MGILGDEKWNHDKTSLEESAGIPKIDSRKLTEFFLGDGGAEKPSELIARIEEKYGKTREALVIAFIMGGLVREAKRRFELESLKGATDAQQ